MKNRSAVAASGSYRARRRRDRRQEAADSFPIDVQAAVAAAFGATILAKAARPKRTPRGPTQKATPPATEGSHDANP